MMHSLTPDQTIAILVVLALAVTFAITMIAYYNRAVRPLQPYLYLLGVLSVREGSLQTGEMIRKDTTTSLKTLFSRYASGSRQHETTVDDLDTVLNFHYQQSLDEVLSNVPSAMRLLIQAITIDDEIVLIKALLKRLQSSDDVNVSEKRLQSLPRGTIPEAVLRQALLASSVSALKQALQPTLHHEFISLETQQPSYLTSRLVETLYQRLLATTAKPGYKNIRPLVTSMIDKHNLIQATRNEDDPRSSDFIGGGDIPPETIKRHSSSQDLLGLLEKTYPVSEFIKQHELDDPGEIIRVSLLQYQQRYAKQQSIIRFQHPLRVLAYVISKQVEMMNVRTLALSKELEAADHLDRRII